MKLGHFSIIRVAFEILPETTRELMPIAAVLCIFSIMYGGFVAYYAKDTKYVIGYSQFQPHGLCLPRHGGAGLHQSERRRHLHVRPRHGHRHALRHGRLGLRPNAYPRYPLPRRALATACRSSPPVFIVACMASIGMPGTVNFIAEVMIIVGSWNKYPFQVVDRRPGHRADDGLPVQDDAGAVLRADGREIQSFPRCGVGRRPLAAPAHDRREYRLRHFPRPSVYGGPIGCRSVDRAYYEGRSRCRTAVHSSRQSGANFPGSREQVPLAKVVDR